jgi:gamma-glutamylcyclotransferase (GGCT)/AIG2-like uncharacterized protein YtfP
MEEYLFSYGTLQKEKVQIDLFGRTLGGSADVLRGYKVSTIEITDETFLSKGEGKYQKTLVSSSNENDIVRGTVFEITRDELLKADGYEPGNYKRTKVMVDSGKIVWIYVATGDDGK